MSIGSILNMANAGMNAQQVAIQIASQNISNAQDTGYSRESVVLTPSYPTTFPYGSVGTGVNVQTITRARDTLLDATYRSDAGAQSSADATSSALSQIQDVFGEPSDTGLSSALTTFFGSWSDLANDPTNTAAKAVVIGDGNSVATMLNQFAGQLDSIDQSNRVAMNTDVGQVNSLSTQIAQYNQQILSAQSGGQPANDLLDARDNLLDQMSQLTGAQVVNRPDGSAAVYVGGQLLVDGSSTRSLEMNDGQPPTVAYSGSSNPLTGIGGQLGAEIQISATVVPGVMSQLDSVAKGLVESVNAIHSTGQTFNGNPPVASPAGNFFAVSASPPASGDPLLTARGIKVAITDPNQIAAAGPTATGIGNIDNATAIAALATTPVTLSTASGQTTSSLSDYYSTLIGNVATATGQAQDESTVQQTLTSNADTKRQSVSGVSTDEELINVIQFQHAYQAAARLVTVVDQMAQTLIDLGT